MICELSMRDFSELDLNLMNESIQYFRSYISSEIPSEPGRKLLYLDEEYLFAAMDLIKRSQGLTSIEELQLEFLINVRRFHLAYYESGELLNYFEEDDTAKSIFIDLSDLRSIGKLKLIPISKSMSELENFPMDPVMYANVAKSIKADEILVQYSDMEYRKSDSRFFNFLIKLRSPSSKDVIEINQLRDEINNILQIKDPLSQTQAERTSSVNSNLFLDSSNENIDSAWLMTRPYNHSFFQKELFDFWFTVKRIFNRWQETGEPWKMMCQTYSKDISKGYVEVHLQNLHEGKPPDLSLISLEKLEMLVNTSTDKLEKDMWEKIQGHTESCHENFLLLNFIDRYRSKSHGFPFDMSMTLKKNIDLI